MIHMSTARSESESMGPTLSTAGLEIRITIAHFPESSV